MTDQPPNATGGGATGGGRHLLPGRCPRCGEGALFSGPFTVSLGSACERCALDYTFADAGDGPAVFAIMILGCLVLGGAMIAEFKLGFALWAHLVLWGLLTPLLALVLLRWLKARLIALQFKHNAGEGRINKTPAGGGPAEGT